MSRFNTRNPLGSNDPRDLDDNAKNMDLAMNSDEDQWIDRFDRRRLTLSGQENRFSEDQSRRDREFEYAQGDREIRFNEFISSSGYQFVGDYAAGIEITEYNQLIRDDKGEFWRVSGQVDLPYVTTGDGIPEDDALVPAGDAVLRQDLANPDKGASLVARGVVAVDSVSDLLSLTAAQRNTGHQYDVASYRGGWSALSDYRLPVGGGAFIWDAESTEDGNGGTVLQVPGVPTGRFKRAVSGTTLNAAWFGADPTGLEDSSESMQRCNDAAEQLGGSWVAEGVFFCSEGVVITTSCDLSQADIEFSGITTDQVLLLRAGPNSEIPDILTGKVIRIGRIVNRAFSSIAEWDGYPVGVIGETLIECEVHINEVYGCDVGYRATTGTRNPHAYNKVFLQKFTNCRVGLQLQPGSARGYVNENQFYGGRFHMDSGLGESIPGTRLVQILAFDDMEWGTGWPNNNTFYSLSLEGNGPEYHIEVMGTYNTFFKPRLEASPAKVIVRGAEGAPQTMTGWNSIYEPYGVPSTIRFTHEGAVGGNGMCVFSSRGSWQNAGTTFFSSSANTAHITGYSDGVKNPNDQGDTNYRYRISPFDLRGKSSGDAADRVRIEFQTGRVRLGNGSSEPAGYISLYGSDSIRVFGYSWVAGPDNTHSLGSSNTRWSEVYAGNGTINTSDEREKEQQRGISEAERRVAHKLKGMVRAFKWKPAVAEKGSAARWHFGVMAQSVSSAFSEEGLNASEYGLFCYDEWEEQPEIIDEDGNVLQEFVASGNRYGVRYDQLLAFIISAI